MQAIIFSAKTIFMAGLTLSLASCTPEPAEPSAQTASEAAALESEQGAEMPSGEPITLHARVVYKDSFLSPSIGAEKSLTTNLHLTSEVLRTGSGPDATYALDKEIERVQGSVVANGQVNFSSDDISTQETYQMQGEWPQMTIPTAGQFSIQLPEPSDIGDGLRIELIIKAPVTGVKTAKIISKGQQIDTEVTHSRAAWCNDNGAGGDLCEISFTIDAIPTTAKTAAGEVMLENAKQVYNLQGKKDATGGLLMYSSMVPVYGATTTYENGHFVTRLNTSYTETLDGGSISQQLEIVVWSTERGSNWQPKF